MKCVSWNVNGLRAVAKKGFDEIFASFDADIFALQETKLQEGQNPIDFEGYHEYWNYAEKKGYSGTAVFAKEEPLAVTRGIGVEELDHEGRVLTLEYPEFFFVCVYTPNAQNELARIDFRCAWEDGFRAYLTGLAQRKGVITPFSSSNSGLSYQEFLDERIFLCLPPQAPQLQLLPAPGPQGYAEIGAEEFAVLKDCSFITLALSQQIGRKMAELFKAYGFSPARVIQVDQTLTSLALTIAGAGASLITETSLSNSNLGLKPAMFLPKGDICRRSLYVAHPRSDEPSRAVEEFTRILREVNAPSVKG